MKQLYLIDNFSLGGAQTIVKGLMESGMHKNDAYAIALREKSPTTPIDNPNAICFKSNSKYSFKALKFLKTFILEKKIEIIHCQLPRSILFGYLLKTRFPELKYIIHEQGDIFESRLYAILLRILKKKADGILACSAATREKLQRRSNIDRDKVQVLYNFVDLKRFSKRKRTVTAVYRIAFVGRIERRKGWREFVKAAENFQSDDKIEFLIAGSGSEEKKLRKILNKLDITNLKFLGYKSTIEELYNQIHLLVIPSHFEPMGMVAIEAMACGALVLAADVPGLNEVVQNKRNGWTCSTKSTADLSRTIEVIMECGREEIDNILNNAHEDAKTYSIENFDRKLNEFYSKIF